MSTEPTHPDLLLRVPLHLHPLAEKIRPIRLARILDVLDRRLDSVVPVVEAVRRRHNMSAILRSADAFGLQRVHLITGAFKPSIGAARGSERWLDMVLHAETGECLAGLKTEGFRIFTADLDPHAMPPEEVPIDRPVAIVLGSELVGVSPAARAASDGVVAIPMHGFVESLNVSAAAAVILRGVSMRRRALVGNDFPAHRREQTLTRWLESETAYLGAARVRFMNADNCGDDEGAEPEW